MYLQILSLFPTQFNELYYIKDVKERTEYSFETRTLKAKRKQ